MANDTKPDTNSSSSKSSDLRDTAKKVGLALGTAAGYDGTKALAKLVIRKFSGKAAEKTVEHGVRQAAFLGRGLRTVFGR